jgi:hypothetical protein
MNKRSLLLNGRSAYMAYSKTPKKNKHRKREHVTGVALCMRYACYVCDEVVQHTTGD